MKNEFGQSFLKGVAFTLGILATTLLAATLSSSLTVFSTGNVVSSSAMNGNFSAINSRLGSYCGSTAATTGNLGGYAAGRSLCQTACGNQAAHMCTMHEISISMQLGETIPAGWYSVYARINGSGENLLDCQGWMSNSATERGPSPPGGSPHQPSLLNCNTSVPVLCCS